MSTVSLTDDGNIRLEVGEPDDIITQLGKRSDGVFEPYSIHTRYDGVNGYYCYVIKSDYVPANFKNSDEFIETLRIQASTNEYIENYTTIAGEYLNEYLTDAGLLDENTYYIQLPSDISDMNDVFFDSFIGMSNNFEKELFTLNDDLSSESLQTSPTAPQEAVDYFEDIFQNLNKVDAYYEFEDLKIDPKKYIYLNGFLNINKEKLDSIPENSHIVVVGDQLHHGHIFYDAIDQLIKHNFNVVAMVSLFRQL